MDGRGNKSIYYLPYLDEYTTGYSGNITPTAWTTEDKYGGRNMDLMRFSMLEMSPLLLLSAKKETVKVLVLVMFGERELRDIKKMQTAHILLTYLGLVVYIILDGLLRLTEKKVLEYIINLTRLTDLRMQTFQVNIMSG
jgi:hypothetical protein